MGLDFTSIKDQPGSAIYFIHDGTEQGRAEFEALASRVGERTRKQVVLMSALDKNGSEIIKFYQLRGLEHVVIVRDDDQLHHKWAMGDKLDPAEIAFLAEQAG